MNIIDWFDGARWRASLAHAIMATGVMLFAWPNPAAFATGVITYFYIREVMEWAIAAKAPGAHISTVEYKGMLPWNWVSNPVSGGWYAVSEFLTPTVVALFWYALWTYLPEIKWPLVI
jgi:hypothetical protein